MHQRSKRANAVALTEATECVTINAAAVIRLTAQYRGSPPPTLVVVARVGRQHRRGKRMDASTRRSRSGMTLERRNSPPVKGRQPGFPLGLRSRVNTFNPPRLWRIQMAYNARTSHREQGKSSSKNSRKRKSLQKPNGVIGPRVQRFRAAQNSLDQHATGASTCSWPPSSDSPRMSAWGW